MKRDVENDFEGALQDFQAVVAHYPDTEIADYSLRHAWSCFSKLGKYKEGLDYLEDVAAEHKGTELAARALYLTISSLIRMGDLNAALVRCDVVVSTDSESWFAPCALFEQASIYECGLGDRDKADAVYACIVTKYPDSEVADLVLRLGKLAQPPETREEEAQGIAKLSSTPNPFNPYTIIQFTLSQSDKVNLSIHNVLGQQVAVLVNEMRQAGTHVVVWDGRDAHGIAVGSGLYFARLEAGGTAHTRKLLLVR